MTLEEARRRAGCSAAVLDRLAGLRPGTVAAIESRALVPDAATASKIAAALCVEVERLRDLAPPAGASSSAGGGCGEARAAITSATGRAQPP